MRANASPIYSQQRRASMSGSVAIDHLVFDVSAVQSLADHLPDGVASGGDGLSL